MDHFEPPREPPGRGGVRGWPAKVWSFYLDYGEGTGAAGVVRLVVWAVVLLALIAVGTWGCISRS